MLTAGAIVQGKKTSTSIVLNADPATGGTGPYTYQWYMSTTEGFSPGGGNIISGATDLELLVEELLPNVPYYFKMVSTDTGHSNDTVTSSATVVLADSQNPNQFAQTPLLGQVDLRVDYNTIAVEIDVSQVAPLYAGSPVKIVDSAGGVPKVVGCAADSDNVFGFINYNVKNKAFLAGDAAEISQDGNVMFMVATAAIARGAQVVLDLVTAPWGGIAPAAGNSGKNIVGWAVDKAVNPGDFFRVRITSPSFQLSE